MSRWLTARSCSSQSGAGQSHVYAQRESADVPASVSTAAGHATLETFCSSIPDLVSAYTRLMPVSHAAELRGLGTQLAHTLRDATEVRRADDSLKHAEERLKARLGADTFVTRRLVRQDTKRVPDTVWPESKLELQGQLTLSVTSASGEPLADCCVTDTELTLIAELCTSWQPSSGQAMVTVHAYCSGPQYSCQLSFQDQSCTKAPEILCSCTMSLDTPL